MLSRSMQDYDERRLSQYGEKYDKSSLNPEFVRYFESQVRVKVQFGYGVVKCGTIGITTGWKPCFLLMARCTSTGSSDTIGPNDKVIAVKGRWDHQYKPVR